MALGIKPFGPGGTGNILNAFVLWIQISLSL
jgi:hypothetical protein